MLISKCCQCGPSQCVFTDHFAKEDIRYETTDTPAGSAASFDVDEDNGHLVGTGDGSYTLETNASGATKIEVAAMLLDDESQTESGVTIRRADSTEAITLVRVWGTTDAYELRQGTTVLESFTQAGIEEVRLVLLTPNDATTDIECYVGGVLAHTESAVAFVMPDDTLNLGVIGLGGGLWDRLTISPCPRDGCVPRNSCASFTVPHGWLLEAMASGSDPIPLYDGSFVLLNRQTVYHRDVAPGQGWEPTSNPCMWRTVWEGKEPFGDTETYPVDLVYFDPDCPPGPSALNCLTTPELLERWFPVKGVISGAYSSFAVIDGATPPPGAWEVTTGVVSPTKGKLVARAREIFGGGSFATYATYESAEFDNGSDLTLEPITLNKVSGTGFGDTITLTPNGDRQVAQEVSGCGRNCSPALASDDVILLSFTTAAIEAGSGVVCMGGALNSATGSFEFTGGGTFEKASGGPAALVFTILCIEPEEGAEKGWYLKIEGPGGTEYLPFEISDADAVEGSVSGTVTVIDGSEAFAATTGAAGGELEPVFEGCCSFDDLKLCTILGGLTATGDLDPLGSECGLSCAGDETTGFGIDQTGPILIGGTTPLESLEPTFDPDERYMRFALPFDDPGGLPGHFDDWFVVIWCDGSNIHACILSGSPANATYELAMTVVSVTCDPLEIVAESAVPAGLCCQDDIGKWTITITQ